MGVFVSHHCCVSCALCEENRLQHFSARRLGVSHLSLIVSGFSALVSEINPEVKYHAVFHDKADNMH